MKQKILSLTRQDFTWEYYCGSGNCGQNRNRRATCVRLTHMPSGAITLGTEEREQWQNKKLAFKRMGKHPVFLNWCKGLINKTKTKEEIEKEVDESLKDSNLKIEYGSF